MSTSTSELHVIFGTGPVGRAIMVELIKCGKTIRMVNRSGRGDLPQSVEVVSGDATDKTFTVEAAQGATHIYFALNPEYTQWVELFPKLQSGVLHAAIQTGAKLIVMENVYMYGDTDGVPMTEDTTFNPDTRKGRVRAQMAHEIMDAHQSGKVQAVVVRASDFFGEYVKDSMMGERVFEYALLGKSAQIIGALDMPHTQSYIGDVGKVLATVAEADNAYGQVWHVPSVTVTQQEFVDAVFKELGTEPKIQRMPYFMLRIISLFMPVLREVLEMRYEYDKPFIVDGSKVETHFGITATPLDEAIRNTVVWYKGHMSEYTPIDHNKPIETA